MLQTIPTLDIGISVPLNEGGCGVQRHLLHTSMTVLPELFTSFLKVLLIVYCICNVHAAFWHNKE